MHLASTLASICFLGGAAALAFPLAQNEDSPPFDPLGGGYGSVIVSNQCNSPLYLSTTLGHTTINPNGGSYSEPYPFGDETSTIKVSKEISETVDDGGPMLLLEYARSEDGSFQYDVSRLVGTPFDERFEVVCGSGGAFEGGPGQGDGYVDMEGGTGSPSGGCQGDSDLTLTLCGGA